MIAFFANTAIVAACAGGVTICTGPGGLATCGQLAVCTCLTYSLLRVCMRARRLRRLLRRPVPQCCRPRCGMHKRVDGARPPAVIGSAAQQPTWMSCNDVVRGWRAVRALHDGVDLYFWAARTHRKHDPACLRRPGDLKLGAQGPVDPADVFDMHAVALFGGLRMLLLAVLPCSPWWCCCAPLCSTLFASSWPRQTRIASPPSAPTTATRCGSARFCLV